MDITFRNLEAVHSQLQRFHAFRNEPATQDFAALTE